MIKVTRDNHETINITISQVRALSIKDDNSCWVRFYNGKSNELAISELNLHDFVDYVVSSVGNDTNYGEISYRGHTKNFSYHHRIQICREADRTPHKTLCPFCGSISQVYHSQQCHCKVTIPFTGKLSEKNTKLTRQVVNLDLREGDLIQFKKMCDRYGDYTKEKQVFDIKWDKDLKLIIGVMEIKKGVGIHVYTDEIDNINELKEKRYHWFRIEPSRIDTLFQ